MQGSVISYLLLFPFISWSFDAATGHAAMIVWGIGFYVVAVSKDVLLLPRPHQVCYERCCMHGSVCDNSGTHAAAV